MTGAWTTYNVFYYDNHDFLLKTCLLPLVQSLEKDGLIDGYFFLRYWEEGPHVRLRLRASDTQAVLMRNIVEQNISMFLKKYPNQLTLSAEFYKERAIALAKYEQVNLKSPDTLMPNNSFHLRDYHREYDKYGGHQGIEIAESVFIKSSKIIANLMQDKNFTKHKKIMDAFIMMCLGMSAFNVSLQDMLLLFKQYYFYWKNYINLDKSEDHLPVWEDTSQKMLHVLRFIVTTILEKNKFEDNALTEWHNCMLDAKMAIENHQDTIHKSIKNKPNTLKSNMYLLTNYLHTHNNRHGIFPTEEAFLAYIGIKAIESMLPKAMTV